MTLWKITPGPTTDHVHAHWCPHLVSAPLVQDYVTAATGPQEMRTNIAITDLSNGHRGVNRLRECSLCITAVLDGPQGEPIDSTCGPEFKAGDRVALMAALADGEPEESL